MTTTTHTYKTLADAIAAATGDPDTITISKSVDSGILDLDAGTDKLTLLGDGNDLTVNNVEFVTGAAGEDNITADGALTTIDLGGDEDSLTILAGDDADITVKNVETITATTGEQNITLAALAKGVAIDLGGGNDTVKLGNFANNVFVQGVETVTGGTGADVVTVDDSLTAGSKIALAGGNDKLILADGGNVVTVDSIETVNGGEGDDVVTLASGQKAGTFNLGDGDDTINFAATDTNLTLKGVESVLGGAGNDTVTFSARVDDTVNIDLAGGSKDRVVLGNYTNVINLYNVESVTGGTGADTVQLHGTGVTATFDGKAGTDTLDLSDTDGASVNVTNVEAITASANDDTINFTTATTGTVDLGDGNDHVLLAKGGTLTLTGVELVDGGAGADNITFTDALAAGVVHLGKGTDSLTLADEDNIVSVSGVEVVTGGISADTVTVSDLAQKGTIDLGDGEDVLNLTGAVGLVVKNVETINGDATANEDITVTIDTDAAQTTVDLGASAGDKVTLTNVVDDATLSTVSIVGAETITGGTGADTIWVKNVDHAMVIDLGKTGANVLNIDDASTGAITVSNVGEINGGAGIDLVTLKTAAAGTTIDLDDGVDVLTLSDGLNSVNVSNTESIVGGKGNDYIMAVDGASAASFSFDGKGGVDTVDLSNLTAGAEVSVQNVENVTGSDSDDTVTISSGNTTAIKLIDLGLGDDTLNLNGLAVTLAVSGVETITVGTDPSDSSTDSAGQVITFNDQVKAADGLTVDLADGADSVTFAGGFEALATATLNNVETIKGGSTADVIELGDAAAVSIDLAGGLDTLKLAAAVGDLTISNVETLIGSTGDDTISLKLAVSASNSFDLGDGDDTLKLLVGGSNITVTNAESITGSAAVDQVTLSDDNAVTEATIDLGKGADILNLGTSGASTPLDYEVTVSGAEKINGFAGADIVHIADGGAYTLIDLGAGTTDQLDASNATLALTATLAGVESVTGSDNNDVITYNTSALAAGHVDLGDGDDKLTLLFNGANDITILNVESVIGGAGSDKVTVDADAPDVYEGSVALGAGTGDTLILADAGSAVTVTGVENITGGTGVDKVTYGAVFVATSSAMVTDLGDGADKVTLFASGTNEVYLRGVEQVTGGSGIDTVHVLDAVTEGVYNLGDGKDVLDLQAAAEVTVGAVETVNGSDADNQTVTLKANYEGGTFNLGTTSGDADTLVFQGAAEAVTVKNVETITATSRDHDITVTANGSGLAATFGSGSDIVRLASGGSYNVASGGGWDEFHFTTTGTAATLTISDFTSGEDSIVLDKGVVTAMQFSASATAFTAGVNSAYFDTASHELRIDTNHDGNADITVTLTGVTALDDSDFSWV